MKKMNLFISTIVCLSCLLLFACRKEIKQFASLDTPNVSANKLDAAKIFNAKFVAKHISENSKIPGFITLAPQWDKAWTVGVGNSSEYIAIPTIDNHVNKLNTTIRRLFLFQMKNGNVQNAQIVEFLGLNYDVGNNLDYLIKNERSDDITGFSGAIIHYDLNYRWTAGNRFENGRLKYRDAAITSKLALSSPGKRSPLFLSTVERGMTGRLQVHNERYLFTPSAQANSTSGESGDESTSDGGTLSDVVITPPPGGGGGYGGNPPPPPPPPPTEPPAGGGGGSGTSFSFINNAVLCMTVPFTHLQDGYTAGISNLGFTASITPSGGSTIRLDVVWGATCITIPDYNTSSMNASIDFLSVYNASVKLIEIELKNNLIPSEPNFIKSFLQTKIIAGLNILHPGSAFTTGPCQGIPQTPASYCP